MHGLMMKTGPKRTFLIDKEQLERLYQEMPAKKIAELYGVGETVVHARIKEYGVTLKGFQNPRRRPKKFTDDHLQAIRVAGAKRRGKWAGENNPRWKGGATNENLALRRSGAYKEWKLASLALRENKCQQCGALKGSICRCCGNKISLHVHHVLSFAKFPEKRFDPENSEVLCAGCHHSRHSGKIG